MTFMSRTFGNMVVRMAYDNTFAGDSQQKLGKARAALRARTRAASRHAVARGVIAK